jgi:NAD(P)H-dependent FMN reductase
MTRIIGLSGSLRHASFNTSLLRAAAALVPEGVELAIHTVHGIPLYDGDVEDADGIPATVTALAEAIAHADGLLLATPEYNNSIPGVLKNAVDWLSRVEGDIFSGKPVAVIGASPGGFGTILSQNAWLPVLRTLETQPYFAGRLLVSKAATLFDPAGTLTDEPAKRRLTDFLTGFATFVQASTR